MRRTLSITAETFPLRESFVISRGAKTAAHVIRAAISQDGLEGPDICGWGECVPYARYGETLENVTTAMETARTAIESGCSREELQGLLPPGAARNALDCALWDLDARRLSIRA
ncbi:MAG: dipeptide epimerase, partial [Alphaproteobacteria bacterium]|nr:dipeptide epimerase [Alphaproteobacteria bacterium]